MAGKRIFVEASAGPGLTVFKDPTRRRSVWALIGGTVLSVWGISLLSSSVPFGGGPLLVGAYFLLSGMAAAFRLVFLVIDSSAQTVTWIRQSPLGRKGQTVSFQAVRDVLVSNRVLGGDFDLFTRAHRTQ